MVKTVVVGVVAIIVIIGFMCLAVFCALAINRPRTKDEEALRFRQDCEEFDKYMEDKRKEE